MMALSPPDRNRLAGILGMLGSSHAGERDAAALAADRFVRARGIAWPDLLAGEPAAPSQAAPVNTLQADIALCRAHPGLLTEWERVFLRGLKAERGVSPKQRRILIGMVNKVRGV